MVDKRCFVAMGYGTRVDMTSGREIDLDRIYHEVVKPVVRECGYECIRGDEIPDSGLIDESMYYGLLESDLVIADISTLNANAIYELGVRHGVRKYRTIIMMESGDQFIFDLNHIRTLTYTYHKTKKAFDGEAIKIKESLRQRILNIEQSEQIVSPIYRFIQDLQEPQRTKTRKEESKSGRPLYERINEAVSLKNARKYAEALPLFESLARDIKGDPFFKQQMALCTYKQNSDDLATLDKAYNILEPIAETIDPETNGLIGAIFKRRFYLTNDSQDIDKAIEAYKKAYSIFGDNYTGENYAFCLLLKSSICEDAERDELRIVAKHIYRELLSKYKEFKEEDVNTEYECWVVATLAACAVVLENRELHKQYEDLFMAKATMMMKQSYHEQMEKLYSLLQ